MAEKKKYNRNPIIQIVVSKGLRKRIEEDSKKMGLSMSSYINTIIIQKYEREDMMNTLPEINKLITNAIEMNAHNIKFEDLSSAENK